MLPRFFSRNVPEQRIADALEHQQALESQEVLRERSAVILGRLEKRQSELKRAEAIAREKAKREAKEAEAAAEKAKAEARALADEAVADTQHRIEAESGAAMEPKPDVVVAAETAPNTAAVEPATPIATEDTSGAQAPAADEVEAGEPPVETAEAAQPVEDLSHRVEPATEFHAPEADTGDVDQPAAIDSDLEQAAAAARARIAARLEQLRETSEAAVDEPSGRAELGDDTPPLSLGEGNER